MVPACWKIAWRFDQEAFDSVELLHGLNYKVTYPGMISRSMIYKVLFSFWLAITFRTAKVIKFKNWRNFPRIFLKIDVLFNLRYMWFKIHFILPEKIEIKEYHIIWQWKTFYKILIKLFHSFHSFVPHVSSFMLSMITNASKGCTTNFADVWFVSSMNINMILERLFRYKTFWTNIALIFLVSIFCMLT